jgi:hypothetical protein
MAITFAYMLALANVVVRDLQIYAFRLISLVGPTPGICLLKLWIGSTDVNSRSGGAIALNLLLLSAAQRTLPDCCWLKPVANDPSGDRLASRRTPSSVV